MSFEMYNQLFNFLQSTTCHSKYNNNGDDDDTAAQLVDYPCALEPARKIDNCRLEAFRFYCHGGEVFVILAKWSPVIPSS